MCFRHLPFFFATCLILLLASSSPAAADHEWLYAAKTCEDFARGLSIHFGSQTAFSQMAPEEISFVLREACGERFSHCGFGVCAREKEKGSGEISGNPQSQQNQSLTEKSVETDPLAWLDRPLTCEQLKDEIQARYAPFGSLKGLPESKLKEVRSMLDSVCSLRFAHCGFKSCERLSGAKNARARLAPSAPQVIGIKPFMLKKSTPGELWEGRARVRLREIYRRRRNMQLAEIEMQMRQEDQDGLEWKSVKMPGEIRPGTRKRTIRPTKNENQAPIPASPTELQFVQSVPEVSLPGPGQTRQPPSTSQ